MVDVWGQGPCGDRVPATPPGRGGEQHLGWALRVTAAPLGHLKAWVDAAARGRATGAGQLRVCP